METGRHDSLLDAGSFLETIEKRQGPEIACVEEDADRLEYVEEPRMRRLEEPMRNCVYGCNPPLVSTGSM